MDFRKIVNSVFSNEKPDFMGWFGDLTYWHDSHTRMGDLPCEWQGSTGFNRLHTDLGVGHYIPGIPAYDQFEGPEVIVTEKEENGVLVRTWQTPVGSIQEVSEYSPISYSWGFREHAIKKVEDLNILRYIISNRTYTPNHKRVLDLEADRGNRGFVMVDVPGTPMAELFRTWMGIFDLTYMLADAPGEIYKTIDVFVQSYDKIFDITVKAPGSYIMVNENLSAAVMGSLFDLHSRDDLTRRVAQLHRAGKKVIIHVDGTMRGIIEKLPATGVDCLDAITPKPVGDVGMEEIRNLVGSDLILLGGLPGAMFAPPFTPQDMEKHILNIIKLHKNSGKFMFGVADQVPPNGDLNIVRLVGELVGKYGKY